MKELEEEAIKLTQERLLRKAEKTGHEEEGADDDDDDDGDDMDWERLSSDSHDDNDDNGGGPSAGQVAQAIALTENTSTLPIR